METSLVTDDGQITIPKWVQEKMGIGPGSEVEFRLAPDGRAIMEKVDSASTAPDVDRFASLRGIAGPGPSTDEIMAELRGD
jgi:antitoxin PrlF